MRQRRAAERPGGRTRALDRSLWNAAIAVVAGAVVAAPAAAPSQPSTKTIVAAVAKYVADYQKTFAFLLSDETYVQRTFADSGRQTAERTMHGEFFLTYLPADGAWIAVHDVADVDGVPVPDRQNLQALLRTGHVTQVARDVADRNARFNIGGIERNINEPTLPLLIFDEGRTRNFTFSRKDVRDEDGVTVATLAFSERDRPTLVHSPAGAPVYAQGTLLVETGTGRIRQTQIQFKDGAMHATLATTYAPDDTLGLWVPAVFTERYESTRRPRDLTTCEARYTNYRRFDVTGRIK
jgi:hypothetical protein